MTTIAVIGTGAMGRGIIQWAVESGAQVLAYDMTDGAADAARSFVHGLLDRAVTKGRMTAAERDDHLSRIIVTPDMGALTKADVVIEAIVEDLDAKRALFAQLENIVRNDTLLCSNTSSLSVTAIANGCRHPERVAGLHFFNPVPLMRVVEVIKGSRTGSEVLPALLKIVGRTKHHPVVCSDSPGFVINHAGRGLYTEGLRIVQENVATPVDVDRVMRSALGLPMGPFELFDLTGLDVSGRVLHEIYDAFYQEPRFRPSPLVRQRIASGLFGRKSGQGFYQYDGNKKIEPTETPSPSGKTGRIHVAAQGGAADHLTALLRLGGAEIVDPENAETIIIAPEGNDATTAALHGGCDPSKTVAIDLMFPAALNDGGRATLMTNPATLPAHRDAVHAALARAGLAVTIISDSPGFIAQRIASTIVNTACEIAQQAIASPADIDAGVTGGLGYPVGPLTLGDQIGAGKLLSLLQTIHENTGDPRYRPSLWLRRRAALGLSLTQA